MSWVLFCSKAGSITNVEETLNEVLLPRNQNQKLFSLGCVYFRLSFVVVAVVLTLTEAEFLWL